MTDIDLNRLPPVLPAREAEVRQAPLDPRQRQRGTGKRSARRTPDGPKEAQPEDADDKHQIDGFA